MHSGCFSQKKKKKWSSCGDISWQCPSWTGLCLYLGRPTPGSPPSALAKLCLRAPASSFWIPTYCSWKKGCPAQPRLLSSHLLSKRRRICTTRGTSWWMSTRAGYWKFWAWGIGYLCLGCWRWDTFSLCFIWRGTATLSELAILVSFTFSLPVLLGPIQAWTWPLLTWLPEVCFAVRALAN